MGDIGLLAVHNHLENANAWDAFGMNSGGGAGFEPIWAMDGAHTEITTAAALYVSSSSGSDTFDVTITGLDADWNLQTETQTLAGQTKTEVGSGLTWIRVWKITNVSTGAAAGDVYCYVDCTPTTGVPGQAYAQLKMPIGYERSLAARLSVPAGKSGRIIQWGGYIAAATASEIDLMYRPFGEIAEVRRVMSVYFNGGMIYYVKPLVCASKSDVSLRGKGATIISGEIGGYYHDA